MVDKLDGTEPQQWSMHDDFWMAECIKDSILAGRITTPEQIDQYVRETEAYRQRLSGELIVSTECFCYEGWLVRLDVSADGRASCCLEKEDHGRTYSLLLSSRQAAQEWAKARIEESKSQHRS